MNNIQAFGKFLDQPMLVAKFQQKVPAVLMGSSALYTGIKTYQAPENEKKETFIKTALILFCASLSAIKAHSIASKFFPKKEPLASFNEVKEKSQSAIKEFMEKNNLDNETKDILNKGKNSVLNIKEIKALFETLSKKKQGSEFLQKLIPEAKNESAEKLFSEIGYLSVFGAVPVVGGIAGGITADRITDKHHWKEKVPDKIKEGSYQYLANIFLCNIGAGIALAGLEKTGIRSKAARALAMTIGIVATGIIGGSKIANLIGRHIIDPVCDKFSNKHKKHRNSLYISDMDFIKKSGFKGREKKQFRERTPEILDIGLHTDDIATVSLLSGLKWIEPALPLMYSISGYRAGIGYRN